MPPIQNLLHKADRLRDCFVHTDYTIEGVLELIGESGQDGLARNSTVPANVALEQSANHELASLIRLWILQTEVKTCDLPASLPVADLIAAKILEISGEEARALIDIRPYGSPDDGANGWVVSDLMPGLDGKITRTRPDYVLGVSPASTTLAQMAIRRPVESALDLGTGCGVQSLHLSQHAKRVVATDLNPRALELAKLSAVLSGVQVEFRLGSLFEPVAEEQFDLIITNPPYVMSPPKEGLLVYRESSFEGDGLVRTIVQQASDHLNPGGTLQVLGNWAHLGKVDWQERLTGWVPEDCDATFIQREVLSPFEYIEMWLTDAGLHGSDDWLPKYRGWLEYFEQIGVEQIGLGWIELQKHDRPVASKTVIEHWPWTVKQPVASAFESLQVARELNRMNDEEILARTWVLSQDVVEETIGEPGQVHPNHVVYRQKSGFCRTLEVSTALGGVLGASDGELPLGVIVQAVASVLDVNGAEILPEVMAGVRKAIGHGMLELANQS